MASRRRKPQSRPGLDELGRSPLHDAAREGNATRCAALLAGGADAGARDDGGWTPLHFAAQAQSAAVTALLLDAGAALEARDAFGNTPLWRATMASSGDGEVIGLLRRAGADPYATNDSGVAPVDLARTIANFQVARFYSDLPENP